MNSIVLKEYYSNQEQNCKKIISFDSNGEAYCYYDDDRWIIHRENVDVNFNSLTGSFKELCKKAIYNEFNSNKIINKQSVASKYIESLVAFEQCIRVCGGVNIEYLNSDKGFRDFILIAQKRKLKYKTWKNYLITLNKLNKNKLLSRRIDNSNELAIILSATSARTQQTIALPDGIAHCYFNSALDIVDKYYSYRKEISDIYKSFIADYNKNLNEGYCVQTSRKKAQNSNKSHLDHIIKLDLTSKWLSRIRGACFIVIAGFTGCRIGEIKSFNKSSYFEEKYGEVLIPLLKGFYTKTNIGGVERETNWVTIPVVKNAIELIWDIYDFAREIWIDRANKLNHIDEKYKMIKEANSLFISYIPSGKNISPVCNSIDKSLTSFIKSLKYFANNKDVEEFNLLNPTRNSELKVGDILIPNPHCFRRTFAVYLIRNRLISMLDLKYQFKHGNLAMSIWYSNQANVASYLDMMLDKDLKTVIEQENHEYMIDTLDYIYNKAEVLSGVEGHRILSLRESSNTSIYLSREEISEQIKNKQLSIVETPSGHCTNPQCNRLCDSIECKYEVITKKMALSLLPKHTKLQDKYKTLSESDVDMPMVLSRIYFEIKHLEKCFKEHSISF